MGRESPQPHTPPQLPAQPPERFCPTLGVLLPQPHSSPVPRALGLLPTRTFPIRGCPVAFRMNTPRLRPSSKGL